MTDPLRKAAEMALEVFDGPVLKDATEHAMRLRKACDLLRQVLAQPEQYDQTALELCDKCGWKAIIPDEGCLVCARSKQKPVAIVNEGMGGIEWLSTPLPDDTPLYTAPPYYWDNVTNAKLVEELRRRDMLMVPVKEQNHIRDATEKVDFVAHLWECIGRWTAMIAHDGEDANLAPPDWLTDAVKAATAPTKREWKGLTDDDKHFLLANAWNKEQAFDGFMDAIDKFLKEKNT